MAPVSPVLLCLCSHNIYLPTVEWRDRHKGALVTQDEGSVHGGGPPLFLSTQDQDQNGDIMAFNRIEFPPGGWAVFT